jgi:hypothetical protein
MERPRVTVENIKRASKVAAAALTALAILEYCSSKSGGYPTSEVIIANEVWHSQTPADGRRYVDTVLTRVNQPEEGQFDGIAIIQGDLIPAGTGFKGSNKAKMIEELRSRRAPEQVSNF